MIILDEKHDAVATRQATDKHGMFELKRQRPLHIHRLREAEADVLRWKTECQQLLQKLASARSDNIRLMEELRKAKKTAVLIMNRQYSQVEMLNGAPQLLSRTAAARRMIVRSDRTATLRFFETEGCL